jgi:hypothetical protein
VGARHAPLRRDVHIRVITLISGRRCQGRPTIKASNWVCVNDNGIDAASRGHAK